MPSPASPGGGAAAAAAAATGRAHVLAAVREALAKEASWSPEQFYEAAEYLRGTAHGSTAAEEEDDLQFLVLTATPAGWLHATPFLTLRRQANQPLPPEFAISGARFSEVSWDQTLLLSLVLRTGYELTVVSCSQDALPLIAEGRTDVAGAVTMRRRVYACPSHTPVNLGHAGAAAKVDVPPIPSYPDICFSMSDGSACDDLVLERPDDCYCVLLHALLPSADTTQPPVQPPQQQPVQPQRLVLFSAYVVQQQVAQYLAERPRERVVVMNGPGGVGRAEVAVAWQGPGAEDSQPHQPLLSLVQRGLRAVATVLLDLDPDEPPGNPGRAQARDGVAGGSLQCALLTLVLPVGALADAILAFTP